LRHGRDVESEQLDPIHLRASGTAFERHRPYQADVGRVPIQIGEMEFLFLAFVHPTLITGLGLDTDAIVEAAGGGVDLLGLGEGAMVLADVEGPREMSVREK
jgi:hypothetical protein